MIINNWEDFCEAFYGDRDASEERIAKAVYSHTRCGCVFRKVSEGVEFAGYAEGAEAECYLYQLSYPFDMDTFLRELDEADAEGVELWHEWNDPYDDLLEQDDQ